VDELVQFLRERLDEDEALARAASPGPWRPNEETDEVVAVDGITVADGFALSGRQLRATTEHIARHDPPRVLAEVDAKRQIIDLHGGDLNIDLIFCAHCEHHAPCPTLLMLALPYVDHPAYKSEWRP
jgi:hypothetical protein